jgi:hypothetical protein
VQSEVPKLVGTLGVFVASVVFGWRVQYHAIVFRGRSDSFDRAERITKFRVPRCGGSLSSVGFDVCSN